MAELLKQAGVVADAAGTALPVAASPTGETPIAVIKPDTTAIAAPNGAPVADRVKLDARPSDKNGPEQVVVKDTRAPTATAIQGRDLDVISDMAKRVGVDVAEATSTTGRRAAVLSGDPTAVMPLARALKGMKEERAARPFLKGYCQLGAVYQIGSNTMIAPGGLLACEVVGGKLRILGAAASPADVDALMPLIEAGISAAKVVSNG